MPARFEVHIPTTDPNPTGPYGIVQAFAKEVRLQFGKDARVWYDDDGVAQFIDAEGDWRQSYGE